ncbi:MAG: IS630 family transposase [Planctomycetaceae bacterium]
MRMASVIVLPAEVRSTLLKWSRSRKTEARLVQRAKIALLAAEGLQSKEIARRLKADPGTVKRWRRPFAKRGLAAIAKEAAGRGRVPSPKLVSKILEKATQEKPPGGATHWSTRTLAKRLGTSKDTVQRVWKQHNLQPHLINTFKVSNDPNFEEKLHDAVGLYLNPPEHAIVLSVDEKSQIQALNRTQKSLSMFPGRLGTLTHDYKRNGTTTLFAAMNIADGSVLADFKQRHRHQEWLDFLKTINAAYPEGELHIICDNDATHKHEKVRRWLQRHPRFHVHLTPTSSSWLNLVERWFRDMLGLATNSIPVKAAMQILDMDTGEVRLPLTPLSEADMGKLKGTLTTYGLL